MTEARVTIKARVGLHARPAARLVQEAMKHECRIEVEAGGRKADGKSILQVLALGVQCGEQIAIRAEGAGEAEAVRLLTGVLDHASLAS